MKYIQLIIFIESSSRHILSEDQLQVHLALLHRQIERLRIGVGQRPKRYVSISIYYLIFLFLSMYLCLCVLIIIIKFIICPILFEVSVVVK